MTDGKEGSGFNVEDVRNLEPGDLVEVYVEDGSDGSHTTAYFVSYEVKPREDARDAYMIWTTEKENGYTPEEVNEKAGKIDELAYHERPDRAAFVYEADQDSDRMLGTPTVQSVEVVDSYRDRSRRQGVRTAAELFGWGDDQNENVSAALDD